MIYIKGYIRENGDPYTSSIKKYHIQ